MVMMMMMVTSVLRMVQPSGMNGRGLSSILAQPRLTGVNWEMRMWIGWKLYVFSDLHLTSVNLEMVIGKFTFLVFSIKEKRIMSMKVKVTLPAETLPQV